MKKTFSLFLTLILMTTMLVGCAGNNADTSANVSTNNSASASDSASTNNENLPVYTPVFGCHLTDDSVIIKGYEKLIDIMNEKTGGRFQATLSTGGQLGSQRDLLEACNLGTIDFCVGEAGLLGSYVPTYSTFALPFLFDDAEHYLACVEGEPGKLLAEALESKTNLTPVCSASNGFRSVFLQKPVNSLADLKGVKIRTPESPIYVDTFTALGANPTPVNGNEMYSAIQTGVVDGMENVNETIVIMNIYEVVSNCTITKHIHNDQILVGNKDFIASMTEEDRALLMETAAEIAHWITEQSQLLDDGYRTELENQGIVYNEVDLTEFREATKSMYDDLRDEDPLAATILDAVEALRK